jgi:hypothetical protein
MLSEGAHHVERELKVGPVEGPQLQNLLENPKLSRLKMDCLY